MDNITARIAAQASAMEERTDDLRGCQVSETIPAFFRGETDAAQTAEIQRHLESCEACNLLLLALAAPQKRPPQYDWVQKGTQYVLVQPLTLMLSALAKTPAMRGPGDAYKLSQQEIPLPDGRILCVRTVEQGGAQILMAFLEDGSPARYELYTTGDNKILKSVDNARQFKFDMPQEAVTLTVAGTFLVQFEGGA